MMRTSIHPVFASGMCRRRLFSKWGWGDFVILGLLLFMTFSLARHAFGLYPRARFIGSRYFYGPLEESCAYAMFLYGCLCLCFRPLGKKMTKALLLRFLFVLVLLVEWLVLTDPWTYWSLIFG